MNRRDIPACTRFKDKENQLTVQLVGASFLIVGVLLALWRRKRKFDRTNALGIERFANYWEKLGARMQDGLLLSFAFVLVSAGVITLAFQYQD